MDSEYLIKNQFVSLATTARINDTNRGRNEWTQLLHGFHEITGIVQYKRASREELLRIISDTNE